jgi:hypothetical protein
MEYIMIFTLLQKKYIYIEIYIWEFFLDDEMEDRSVEGDAADSTLPSFWALLETLTKTRKQPFRTPFP